MTYLLIVVLLFLGWGSYLNRKEDTRAKKDREWKETPDTGEEIDDIDISPEDRPEPHPEPNPMTREEER